MTDYSILRDFWNRPFITTDGGPLQFSPGRKTPVNAEAYPRISTIAGGADDKSGLLDWVAAKAMIGTVASPAIAAQVAHLMNAYPDPWRSEGKKPLKELVRRAKEAGGADDAAGLGTACHGIWECLDKGNKPQYIPRNLEPWIWVRQAALADYEPLLVEPFVVNDELKIAGSPDRYLRHKQTGIVYAADDKTGADEPSYGEKVTTQVAIASRSVLYDQATGKRTPIECDQNTGLLIHTPISNPIPVCNIYILDLNYGWELAQAVVNTRRIKKDMPKPKLLKRMASFEESEVNG